MVFEQPGRDTIPLVAQEVPRIWATLQLHPLDIAGDRELDARVLAQPQTLLGGAHGHLSLSRDALTWTPGFNVHSFHPIEIAWSEIWRVQLETPSSTTFWGRRLYACMRIFCGRDLIEFSFSLIDSETVAMALAKHLEPGQIDLVSLLP
jgi:hypothetical protein